MMRNLGAAFARLSPRERVLVSIMLGLVVFGGLTFLHFALQGKVNALEASIEKGQKGLRVLYSDSGDFVTARTRARQNRAIAESRRDLNLTTAIAAVAAKVSFEATDTSGRILGQRQLKENLEYAASKVRHINIGNQPRTGSSRQTPTDGYFQKDQEIKLSDGVPLSTLYDFLEKIERAPEGLFVTELRIERDPRNLARAGRNTRAVISTYYHVPKAPGDN